MVEKTAGSTRRFFKRHVVNDTKYLSKSVACSIACPYTAAGGAATDAPVARMPPYGIPYGFGFRCSTDIVVAASAGNKLNLGGIFSHLTHDPGRSLLVAGSHDQYHGLFCFRRAYGRIRLDCNHSDAYVGNSSVISSLLVVVSMFDCIHLCYRYARIDVRSRCNPSPRG